MIPFLLAITTALGFNAAGGEPRPTYVPAPIEIHALSDASPLQQPPRPLQVASIVVELTILHATNDGSGIDPKIGKMPALSKPPFSSYNSYKLIERTNLSLDRGKADAFKLPTGRDLRLLFKSAIEPRAPGAARRYLLDASIQKPDGKSFLPNVEFNANAGETFFVGGQDYNGGSIFIGLKVHL
jgi:hypothetical protein